MPLSNRLLVPAAFAAVYFFWGSTYLAIRLGIESIPPFLMAGSRFAVAGVAVLLWARRRGAPWPSPTEWRSALLVGGLLFLGGNGLVTWAEQVVPSGVAALVMATSPIWIALMPLLSPTGARLSSVSWLGVALGLLAVATIAAPSPDRPVPLLPTLVILAAAVAWASGSLASLTLPLPRSVFVASGATMTGGGAWLLLAGTLGGEWSRLDLSAITLASLGGWAWLVVFGSVVALSAHAWLLRVTSPTAVSTHAFVNPIVAVFLGWALAGERVGPRGLLALGLVVLSVVAMLAGRASRAAATSPSPRAEPCLAHEPGTS